MYIGAFSRGRRKNYEIRHHCCRRRRERARKEAIIELSLWGSRARSCLFLGSFFWGREMSKTE